MPAKVGIEIWNRVRPEISNFTKTEAFIKCKIGSVHYGKTWRKDTGSQKLHPWVETIQDCLYSLFSIGFADWIRCSKHSIPINSNKKLAIDRFEYVKMEFYLYRARPKYSSKKARRELSLKNTVYSYHGVRELWRNGLMRKLMVLWVFKEPN